METRMSKEALLRQVLDAEISIPDDKTIYSYLLGYRLFQSGDQLLKEIQVRLCGKESPEVERRFQRRNQRLNPRSKGATCNKCQKKHENPKIISKSTNNMLEKNNPPLYVEMFRTNVMIQATARPLANNLSTSESDNLSPALSSSLRSDDMLAKSSDFDDYCDIDDLEFTDNRRNTAPPASLQALPSPHKLGQYTQKSQSKNQQTGTDFSTNKLTPDFKSTASLGILLEKLPETNIDDVQCADGVVASGEDTIRRRKKGRRRTTITDSEFTVPQGDQPTIEPLKSETDSVHHDRRSVASRDSGILSGLIDNELDLDFQSNNNNNNKAKSAGNTTETVVTKMQSEHSSQNHDDSGFIPSNDTLDQLAKDIETQICDHLCDENIVPNDAESRQLHLLHVLLVWVRDFPSDFRTTKALGTLKSILGSLEKGKKDLKDHCSQVLDTLSRCTNVQNTYEKYLLDAEKKDTLKKSEDFHANKEDMISMVTGMNDVGDAYKMAEQLCLIEMDLLSHLGAEEFLQMFDTKKNDSTKTNLGASVAWFNRLSHLVATSVCVCRKPKHRRHVISLFTRAASRCYELSNFNSAMAILTGLSLGAVSRLKRTWNKVEIEEIERLQSVFDPSNNFRRYRTMFNERWAAMRSQQSPGSDVKPQPIPENRYSTVSQHSATSRLSVASLTSQHRDSGIECENESASTSKSSPTTSSSTSSSPKSRFTFDDITSRTGIEDGVLVPFLTLMVKDVYFLNHATPTVENDGTINFEKLRHLGEILHPLETWKNTPCVYKKNEELQEFLLHSTILKDSELYNLSYKREPPKNKFEKSQLKTIRAEMEYRKRGNMVRRMIARRKTM
uniref:uncharacterized protein LOC120347414 n=1 Tax=Styela clava TaxID=7725 RepID=UPI00193A443A|nr:uncharacterized protein LOC120347414 [Styela clava]